MSKKIDVSFITINYNSTTHTIELLESIFKHTSTDYEVIVVDNASTCNELNMLEQFCNKYEQVTIVKNRVNSGFASGNMLGINYANAEYYFFINNDTKLLNNCASI
ncbi:MAG: glycosyltransferase, partial [Campylobacterota bacterium]|nr:glycosyltransferase [Campylobacterota bacterium]